MTAYYFDPSAVLKWYVLEIGTEVVEALLDPKMEHTIYIAAIGSVEVITALARRGRIKDAIREEILDAIHEFRADFTHRWRVVELSPKLLSAAEDLGTKHFLRGYDAVHLAAALEADRERRDNGLLKVTLVSSDDALNAAALAEKLAVLNPMESQERTGND